MPLLEEVDEGSEAGPFSAEKMKSEHRRKRSKSRKRKKKTKADTSQDVPYSLSIFGILALATVLVVVGLWSRASVLDRNSNSCKMTMSRPMYVPLAVPGYPAGGGGEVSDNIKAGYGYRLFRYIDGKLPVEDKRNPSKPTGFPVLFVPGHVGSYEQVRSLGSQASEAKVTGRRRRLDVFALDLLGEWTAVHGSLIWRQAEFLNHAVEAILALYADGNDPNNRSSISSVMVVGHSLGGLVARAAFTLPSYRMGSISDIITLGTPHDRAAWMMDYSILGLYRCTDSLWRWHSFFPSAFGFSHCWVRPKPAANETLLAPPIPAGGVDESAKPATIDHFENSSSQHLGDESEGFCLESDGSDAAVQDCTAPEKAPSDVVDPPDTTDVDMLEGRASRRAAYALIGDTVLVSLTGGPKDLMVHPSLCETDGLGVPGQSVAFTTEAMDACGFGVDHLALLWCRQLINRVVTALSELEKLHVQGAGARERIRLAASTMASSSSLSRDSSTTSNGDKDIPRSAGFEEASREGTEWHIIARSLLTDRLPLLIPAWVCVAGLVLAAALIRGLSSKNAKVQEHALPPLPRLLTPEEHLHLRRIKHAVLSVWKYVRSHGTLATVALVASCGLLLTWTFGEDVSRLVPGGVKRILDVVFSMPGGSGAVAVGMAMLRTVGAVVRFLNPLGGAEDALSLPNKGIAALYFLSVGWMIVFVFFVSLLGAMGNGFRRIFGRARLEPSLLLPRSRNGAVFAACVTLLLAHVEKFAVPPKFRPITLAGEFSLLMMVLSLALYGLLVSLALFPSTLPAVATHQRLLLLLYAPVPAVLIGPQIAASQLLLGRGGMHECFVRWGEMALVSLALLPIISSVWFARRSRPFPSPASMRTFIVKLRRQMEEEVARSYGVSSFDQGGFGTRGPGASTAVDLAAVALEHPNGHGACETCLHADGGHGAVFVETGQELVCIGGGVTLGPGFMVVACDCPRREPAAPSSWCEFCRCTCEVCGGCKDAVRALKGSRAFKGRVEKETANEDLRAASAIGLVSVAVLFLSLWAFGMRLMSEPCHALVFMSGMGVIICGLHWGVAKDAEIAFRTSY